MCFLALRRRTFVGIYTMRSLRRSDTLMGICTEFSVPPNPATPCGKGGAQTHKSVHQNPWGRGCSTLPFVRLGNDRSASPQNERVLPQGTSVLGLGGRVRSGSLSPAAILQQFRGFSALGKNEREKLLAFPLVALPLPQACVGCIHPLGCF